MTEKTKSIIEITATSALSIGVDYVIDKTLKKLVNPQSIPEKILTGVGSLGVSCAANYGVFKLVHGALYGPEEYKYHALVKEVEQVVAVDAEAASRLAQMVIKMDNKVDEVYKSIMGGTN